MNRWIRIAVVGTAASLSALAMGSHATAAEPQHSEFRAWDKGAPSVGTCFDYGPKGMQKLTSPSPPVSCGRGHTAEVYKVSPWPGNRNPYRMSDSDLWNVANSRCTPSTSGGFPSSGWFNYWAFFLPTQEQWNRGARWVRCDALRALRTDPLTLDRWRGSRL